MPSVPPQVVQAFLLMLVSLAMVPAVSEACTCVSQGCGSVLATTHMFEATVIAIEAPATAGGDRVVRFADMLPVRGDAAPTFVLAGDGASCDYRFTVGVRYLIDAYEVQPGRFSVSSCSHTKPLVAAGGILAYLSESSPTRRPRVWGRISSSEAGDRWMGPGGPPVAAAGITLSGPVTKRTTANANGEFSFSGVPDGAYTLSVAVPIDRPDVESPAPRTFTLDEASACLDLDVVAPSAARVSGIVVDAAGAPVAGVRVELFPSPYDQYAGGIVIAAETDADGRYEIDRVPPGRYVAGVGVPYPSERNPIAPARARGTDGSSLLTVGPGGRIDLRPLVAQPAPPVTVSGLVSAPQGTRVGGLFLVLQPLDGIATARVGGFRTLADGRFTIEAHRGVSYRVLVESGQRVVGRAEFVAGDEALEIRLGPPQ